MDPGWNFLGEGLLQKTRHILAYLISGDKLNVTSSIFINLNLLDFHEIR
jgi:hypothetical protein